VALVVAVTLVVGFPSLAGAFPAAASGSGLPGAPTPAPTVAPAAPALPFTPPIVIVYGDSIVHAAGPALQAMLAAHGVSLVDASVGGTAPCDALQFVQGDMQKYRPALVVIAYVGNAFSPCINGTPDQLVLQRHYQDTQRLIDAVHHRPVLLATPPGSIGEGPYTAYDELVGFEAAMFGAHVVNTAKALLDPTTHLYEKTVPCATSLTCPPIVVRGLDNYHLTDAGGYLYAQVLAKAVLAQLAARRRAGATRAKPHGSKARTPGSGRRHAGSGGSGKGSV
jgi:hypothetical protein